MFIKKCSNRLFVAIFGFLLFLFAIEAVAAGMTTQQLQEQFQKDVVGKTIVFIPVSNSVVLSQIWAQTMEKEAEALGMNFEVRDPGFNTQRQQQILMAQAHQNPDVLVVQNPNVQVLASALSQANKAGIYTIQLNMASKYKTDAFVGAHPNKLGAQIANGVVDACGGGDARSHEVALMNGEQTSAYSIGMMQGAMSVFDKHDNIEIVSTQVANWDPKTAHDKAANVLQSHPNLCAYMGWWSGQDVGIAQAVKQAGLQGKVKIFTTGGGEPPACKFLKEGLFYTDYSYSAKAQAHEIMAVAKFLLQTHKPAGTFHTAIYSPIRVLTKDTVKPDSCTPTDGS